MPFSRRKMTYKPQLMINGGGRRKFCCQIKCQFYQMCPHFTHTRVNAQQTMEMFLNKWWRCFYADGFKFLAWGSIVAEGQF